MDESQETLKLIRGAIADLGPDDQDRVKSAAAQLRTIVEAFGNHGLMALALVGAETEVATI
jgi:hypothetical protein